MRCPSVSSATRIAVFCLIMFAGADHAGAELKPALVFSDHMVLQRDKPIRVWGEAAPGGEVAVSIGRASQSTKADDAGKWRVELPAMKVDGKAHTLKIQSGGATVELTDIKIGEVWFIAGQSNVAAGMGRPADTVDDLRLMSIDHNRVYGWHVATPDNVQQMPWTDGSKRWRSVSHVAYHFGRHLQQKLGIPVGVMHADHGGSVIAAWMTDTVKNDWPELPGGKPVTGDLRTLPGNLYRYKVKKAAPLNIGGIVWWQGESDARNAKYADNLKEMIGTWRELFEQPKLPFILIQIAPNTYGGGPVGVWEAQRRVAATVDGVTVAPNIDAWVGHSTGVDKATGWPTSGGNPHPPNKDRAARRAANLALQLNGVAMRDAQVLGPLFKDIDLYEVAKPARIDFEFCGEGLKSRDGKPLTWFEVTDGTRDGKGFKWVKAEAKIVGPRTIEVWADGIRSIRDVRFAWSPVAMPNLVNSEGLPAMPFGTSFYVDDAQSN